MALDKTTILAALTEVYDPEIPVDIVNLGLIYDVTIDGGRVGVKMTTTAPGCPVGSFIAQAAEERLRRVDGVRDVRVELVYDPPWNPKMMSEEGKLALGIR